MSERTVVPAEKFVEAYLDEVESNGSCESLAEKLNLKPLSVYQRALKLNEKLLESGKPELPSLRMKQNKTPRASRLDLDKLSDLMRARKALNEVDNVTETEKV